MERNNDEALSRVLDKAEDEGRLSDEDEDEGCLGDDYVNDLLRCAVKDDSVAVDMCRELWCRYEDPEGDSVKDFLKSFSLT